MVDSFLPALVPSFSLSGEGWVEKWATTHSYTREVFALGGFARRLGATSLLEDLGFYPMFFLTIRSIILFWIADVSFGALTFVLG